MAGPGLRWLVCLLCLAIAFSSEVVLSFQTPVTVGDILEGIHHKEYLLPAIQREFVWDADQVRRLVDSLMRGYPIGSFLIWKVSSETAKSYVFYDFLTDYHARDHPYASRAVVPGGQGVLAVLDGQQRLTALNIAVYGSFAVKKKYAWWSSTDAFPKKRLYLNLLAGADPDDLGLRYDLQFLTDEEALAVPGKPDKWYPLAAVMTATNPGPALFAEVAARGVTDTAQATDAYQRLYDLYGRSGSPSRSITTWKPTRTPTRSWTSSSGSTAAAQRCRTRTCFCRWPPTSGRTGTPARKSAS